MAGGAGRIHLHLRFAGLSSLHKLLELYRQSVSRAGVAFVPKIVVERRLVVRERGVVSLPHFPALSLDCARTDVEGARTDGVRPRPGLRAAPHFQTRAFVPKIVVERRLVVRERGVVSLPHFPALSLDCARTDVERARTDGVRPRAALRAD